MRRRYRFLATLTVLLMILALSGSALGRDIVELRPTVPPPSASSTEMIDETPQFWFVEFASPPKVEGTSESTLANERASFRATAKKAGIKFTERYDFDTLWNGLSVEIQGADVTELARLPGVKNIFPVVSIALPDTKPLDSADLATALAMTGADIAQNELGLTGEGVKVAVVDTGIDYEHPDLGGCFADEGCRVETGWDFVGDEFDPGTGNYTIEPDPDPDDCAGHGTHVAGIIGANGDVVGVAPGVTFGAYKVFGCSNYTSADVMIAAMERALEDGMDVLNMSIGSAFQWPEYPTAVAADRLVKRGIVVVTSIGNNAQYGIYSAGAPGVGADVIGVASFDNTSFSLPVFTISPDDTEIGYSSASGSPSPPTEGTYELERTGTSTSATDACDPLPEGSLTGKLALVRRGGCTFHQKSTNAYNAGAIGVVLYNNISGRMNITVEGDPAITIPVVAISDEEGELIDSRLASGPVSMTWTDELGSFENTATGGLISSFSSYGLAPDLSLKPDIGAPGGYIWSTYPLELGGYASLSGTSMSSPHVAGSVALLLEARPNTPTRKVRTVLQNSAVPKSWSLAPGFGFLDHVHRQGAGMLNIANAVQATTLVEPGKISLGESEAGPVTETLTITNSASYDVTYTFDYENALTTTGTFPDDMGFWLSDAEVEFGGPSATVPAGSRVSVDVTITPATEPGQGQYGGYIILDGDDGSTYRVPYAGFVGDYQSIVALVPTVYGFPWLGYLSGESYYRIEEPGYAFTMVGDDVPYILYHLDHQVRLLRFEVFEVGSNRNLGDVLELDYMGRNSGPTSFFAQSWDGYTTRGKSGKAIEIPNGDYYFVLSALKALGDPNNPDHWETWTSPVFTIDRPE